MAYTFTLWFNMSRMRGKNKVNWIINFLSSIICVTQITNFVECSYEDAIDGNSN